MKKYDDILIGSGPAAYKMANLLAKTDRKVLVIEGFEYGGTCPNYGCEPKIFLEGAARTVLQSQQLLGRGISQPAKLDWEALMQTKLKRFDQSLKNGQIFQLVTCKSKKKINFATLIRSLTNMLLVKPKQWIRLLVPFVVTGLV